MFRVEAIHSDVKLTRCRRNSYEGGARRALIHNGIVEVWSTHSNLFYMLIVLAESIYHKIKIDSLTNFWDILYYIFSHVIY